MDMNLMRRQIAESILRSRTEIVRYLEEAEQAGKRKEARSWKSALRKIDKQIETYRLDRYATGF